MASDLTEKIMTMRVGLSCHAGEGTVMSGQKKTGVGAGGALSHHDDDTLSKFLRVQCGQRLWPALGSKELTLIFRRMLSEKDEGFRTGPEEGQEVWET